VERSIKKIILIWKLQSFLKRPNPLLVFYFSCSIPSQLFSLLEPWPRSTHAFTFTGWLVLSFVGRDEVRPYQLLNSPVGGPVATCNGWWGRPWISQSLADVKDLLKQRCLNLQYSCSLLMHQIQRSQHLLSSAPQNWEFVRWEAMGVMETAACALRPEALCPC